MWCFVSVLTLGRLAVGAGSAAIFPAFLVKKRSLGMFRYMAYRGQRGSGAGNNENKNGFMPHQKNLYKL